MKMVMSMSDMTSFLGPMRIFPVPYLKETSKNLFQLQNIELKGWNPKYVILWERRRHRCLTLRKTAWLMSECEMPQNASVLYFAKYTRDARRKAYMSSWKAWFTALSNFMKHRKVMTDFCNAKPYKISWNSHQTLSCNMWTNGQTYMATQISNSMEQNPPW